MGIKYDEDYPDEDLMHELLDYFGIEDIMHVNSA